MPLAKGLLGVLLSHPCPNCGHKQERKGSWFQTVRRYRCSSCNYEVPVTYETKVRLFEANAHRAIQER